MSVTKLIQSVTAGEEMGIDVTSGAENENEIFALVVFFALVANVFLEIATSDVYMVTIALC